MNILDSNKFAQQASNGGGTLKSYEQPVHQILKRNINDDKMV